jgi:murein DD-endopeptidase MepM/ murein hydrolase activator NlpD
LGFSGDTTGPHLHFHVADRASMLEAQGQPFAFDRFSLLGHMDIANLGKQTWSPLAADLDANRRAEWPAYNAVVVFE